MNAFQPSTRLNDEEFVTLVHKNAAVMGPLAPKTAKQIAHRAFLAHQSAVASGDDALAEATLIRFRRASAALKALKPFAHAR